MLSNIGNINADTSTAFRYNAAEAIILAATLALPNTFEKSQNTVFSIRG
jgi:hypothetical protein